MDHKTTMTILNFWYKYLYDVQGQMRILVNQGTHSGFISQKYSK